MLSEQPLDPITKDMRRRLFWTLASMECVFPDPCLSCTDTFK